VIHRCIADDTGFVYFAAFNTGLFTAVIDEAIEQVDNQFV